MTAANERAPSLTERVAEEIRAAMGRRRISGARLARTLGVSDAWVSYRLNGKQPIDLNDLERIAGVLGVEPVNLVASAERTGTQMNSRSPSVPERPPGNSLTQARRPPDNRPISGPRSGPRRPERVARTPVAA